MGPFFVASLIPTLSVALLLLGTTLRRAPSSRGLAALSAAVALWCIVLGLCSLDEGPARTLGGHLAASGAFIAATFLHAAWELTGGKSRGLVRFGYGIAAALTVLGALAPGVAYDPRDLSRGPLFWPTMALAVVAAVVPSVRLVVQLRRSTPEARGPLKGLLLAGALCFTGGLLNAVLLAHGLAFPLGVHLVLASLLVLADVVRRYGPAAERRVLERSLAYAALGSVLSAGFLFGALLLGAQAAAFQPASFTTLLVLLGAALAVEPLRQSLAERLGRRLAPDAAPAAELARALAGAETRADQAGRLAELGQLSAAVAHELRNPLGVIGAHAKLLGRSGADPEALAAIHHELQRATRFTDELLRYGRPRPLELREVDAGATLALALSTARQGLGPLAPEVTATVQGDGVTLEADQGQLVQLCLILVENALLALPAGGRVQLCATRDGARVRLTFDDDGPGVPEAIEARLFQPFVTARPREGPRIGTGLGLAIARGIAERHGGTLTHERSPLGGARFVLTLAARQPVLAAAASAT